MELRNLSSKIILSGLFVLAACASKVTKYNYPADSDSTKVISDLQTELQSDDQSQAGVFAHDSFEQAQTHLNKAKKLQASGSDHQKVLDEAGLAKAYSMKAQQETDKSKAALPMVAEARQSALDAGAADSQPKHLEKADSDFSSYVEKVNDGKATPEKTAEFQQRYSDLELGAITQNQLGQSEQWISQAKDLGATKRTPQSLANAEEDYNNARLVISTDRHDDNAIDAAVKKSDDSSARLLEVAQEAKKSNIPENVAVDVVTKRHAIARLNSRMGESREENAALMDSNAELATHNENLVTTNARL